MNEMSPASARRPGGSGSGRGRPRDPSVDGAIIEAALAELAERGYSHLSMAGVAQRAGVSRPTVYRRWADKAQLITEAIASHMPAPSFPDTGDVADDLLAYGERLVATFTRSPAGQVLPGLVAAIAADPDFAERYRLLLVHPLRRHMHDAVERAISRGQLVPHTDIELLLDAIAGPIYVRLLITGTPIDPAYPRAAVDLVLARYGTA